MTDLEYEVSLDAEVVEEVWIRRPEKGKKFRGRK
jgi:hypothetical protein